MIPHARSGLSKYVPFIALRRASSVAWVAWASVVGGKGWGEMVQEAERGREATSPAMCPNEFIRTF